MSTQRLHFKVRTSIQTQILNRQIKSSWKSIPLQYRFPFSGAGHEKKFLFVQIRHAGRIHVKPEIRLPPQISDCLRKSILASMRTHFKINWHFFHWIWLMIQSLVCNHRWDRLLYLCIYIFFRCLVDSYSIFKMLVCRSKGYQVYINLVCCAG